MIVTEENKAAADPLVELVSNVETRFSIACDAVSGGKSHAEEAAGQFFGTIDKALAGCRVEGPSDLPLDERILGLIERLKPLRNYLLQFVEIVEKSDNGEAAHAALRPFLGSLLGFKHAPRNVITFNHLWCDHYRFFLREVFLGVVATLIARRNFEEIDRYLGFDYRFETCRGPQRAAFLGFDAYIKTLDEFRARRLRQNRLSVSTDLLNARADMPMCSFKDMMQADFILCVRGLFDHPKALTRWFPRTLVFAHDYEKSGFDLFFAAQSADKFGPVAKLLGVRNRAELVEKFAAVSRQCRLDDWKFGGISIPFGSYLALDSAVSA